MIFINPQWQGSGLTNEIEIGAHTSELFFNDYETMVLPLSKKGLRTIDNIKCFEPILEQATSFHHILSDRQQNKVSTIGGDCGITIMPISYLNQIYQGDLCTIWIDAHADLHTPESSPSKNYHGMPLRTLLGEGNADLDTLLFSTIRPEQICFIGLRSVDESERKYILKNDIASYSNCQYLDVFNKLKTFNNIYIHLDLDVLDKSAFKHTMFPTHHGFKIKDVLNLIFDIKSRHEVVGMSITESRATSIDQLEAIREILEEIEI